MAVIWFLVIGFLAGLLARAIMPGKQHMGMLPTTVLGVGGSLLGGFISSLFSHTEPTRIESSGLIGSILGALALLALYMAFERYRSHHHAV